MMKGNILVDQTAPERHQAQRPFASLCLHEVLIRQQSGNLLNCQMIY
jgi:hypothetical protein